MGVDDINLDIKSDVSEGERARETLERVKLETDQLRASFDAGRMGLDNYKAALKDLNREAKAAETALKGLEAAQLKSGALRLTGADRAGAKARLGLAGANILQDGIQGGPASTINNILGMANDGGIKSLLGEGVAAVGGVKGLALGFGTVAVAAGAAFMVIDSGLKQAKLGWGDLTDVLGNTAPISAVGEAFGAVGQILKDWGVTAVVTSVTDAVGATIHTVANLALGWDDATKATKAHKEEVERILSATREAADAQKALAKFTSDAQDTKAKNGKLVGKAVADLGGDGGIEDVVDKVARLVAGKDGDKRKVKVRKLGKKGEDEGEEEITATEEARRWARINLARATEGDTSAMDRLRPFMKRAGFDMAGVDAASNGFDADKDKKGKEAQKKKDDAEAEREQEKKDRELDKRADDLAKPLQERFNLASAKGDRWDIDRVREEMLRSGVGSDEAADQQEFVWDKLSTGFDEEVRKRSAKKGIDVEGAKADLLKEDADERDKKDERAKDAKLKGQVEDARDLFGGEGLDAGVQDALVRYALAGVGPNMADAKVRNQLSGELQARGQSAEDAEAAADAIVSKASAKLGDEIQAEAMKAPELRGPERIDAGSFAASVERAGADTQRQMAGDIGEMKKYLADIARQGNAARRVGP